MSSRPVWGLLVRGSSPVWRTPRRACASMARVYAADSGTKPAAAIAVRSRAASAEWPPLASTHRAACSRFEFGCGFGFGLEPEQLHRVRGAVGLDPVYPHPLQQLQRLRMRRAEAHKPTDLELGVEVRVGARVEVRLRLRVRDPSSPQRYSAAGPSRQLAVRDRPPAAAARASLAARAGQARPGAALAPRSALERCVPGCQGVAHECRSLSSKLKSWRERDTLARRLAVRGACAYSALLR